VDIALTVGSPLFLSSGEIYVNRFGKNQQYSAKLGVDGIQPTEMSVDVEVDKSDFKVTNADMVTGRLLTDGTRRFDGAKAIIGTLFIDTSLDFSTNQHIWDPRMPCELVTGDITDADVVFSAISEIDNVVISGRTIVSEFEWREPLVAVPSGGFGGGLIPGGGGGGGDIPTTLPRRIGRFGESPVIPEIEN